jgi:hypothetical protein
MTDIVERAKALLDNTFTPTPWQVEDGYASLDGRGVWHDDSMAGTRYVCYGFRQGHDDGLGDAEFVAAAPTLVGELIAEVERLRRKVRYQELIIGEEVDALSDGERAELDELSKEFI